jgi:hypothetical protein
MQIENALAAKNLQNIKLLKIKCHQGHHINAGANQGGLYYLGSVHGRRQSRLNNHFDATSKAPTFSSQGYKVPQIVFVTSVVPGWTHLS